LFAHPEKKWIEKVAPELRGNAMNRVVKYDGKNWYVKMKGDPEEGRRDLLAYLLGRNWANVAEVQLLNEDQFQEIRTLIDLGDSTSSEKTFLVRLAQDYCMDELPIKDLDEAVATELVFSLWIRRRDAHPENRAYVQGIPLFFDHQTAFLGEPWLRHLNVFFSEGPDAGYAGRWRIREIDQQALLNTAEVRKKAQASNKAMHFVHGKVKFAEFLNQTVEKINKHDPRDWINAAQQAGLDDMRAREIVAFLEETRSSLDNGLTQMQAINSHE
jgi:hypothetical protein